GSSGAITPNKEPTRIAIAGTAAGTCTMQPTCKIRGACLSRRHEGQEVSWIKDLRVLRGFVMKAAEMVETSSSLDVLRRNSCVVVLQGPDAETFLTQPPNGLYGRCCARKRRDAGHFLHHRGAPDQTVVEEGFTAERGVDDEIHFAIHDRVRDVR